MTLKNNMGFPKPWVLTRVNIHKTFKKIGPVEALKKKQNALDSLEYKIEA